MVHAAPTPEPASDTQVLTGPVRVQLRRVKGWRMPPNTVKVDRSTIFGNPSHCGYGVEGWCSRCDPVVPYCCLDRFREYVTSGIEGRDSFGGTLNVLLDAAAGYPRRTRLVKRLPELRGKDLACWCALDRPCHADVLLELANVK